MMNKILGYIMLALILVETYFLYTPTGWNTQTAILTMLCALLWMRSNFISNVIGEVIKDVEAHNVKLKAIDLMKCLEKTLDDVTHHCNDVKIEAERHSRMLRHNPREKEIVAKDPVLKVKRSTRMKLSEKAKKRKRVSGRFIKQTVK
jgi:hypothetical protein